MSGFIDHSTWSSLSHSKFEEDRTKTAVTHTDKQADRHTDMHSSNFISVQCHTLYWTDNECICAEWMNDLKLFVYWARRAFVVTTQTATYSVRLFKLLGSAASYTTNNRLPRILLLVTAVTNGMQLVTGGLV